MNLGPLGHVGFGETHGEIIGQEINAGSISTTSRAAQVGTRIFNRKITEDGPEPSQLLSKEAPTELKLLNHVEPIEVMSWQSRMVFTCEACPRFRSILNTVAYNITLDQNGSTYDSAL